MVKASVLAEQRKTGAQAQQVAFEIEDNTVGIDEQRQEAKSMRSRRTRKSAVLAEEAPNGTAKLNLLADRGRETAQEDDYAVEDATGGDAARRGVGTIAQISPFGSVSANAKRDLGDTIASIDQLRSQRERSDSVDGLGASSKTPSATASL